MTLDFYKLKAQFRRAERAIKRCERISGAVPTAAINQLRYAGNHLLKVLAPGDDTDVDSEKAKVVSHCRRAWFDAFDAIINSQLEIVRTFESKNCPLDVLRQLVPNYDGNMALFRELYPVFRNVKAVQEMAFAERLALIRRAAALTPFVKALQRLSNRLNALASDMEIDRIRRAEQRDIYSMLMSLMLSVTGSIYSAAGLLTSPSRWMVAFGIAGIVFFVAMAVFNVYVLVQRAKTITPVDKLSK